MDSIYEWRDNTVEVGVGVRDDSLPLKVKVTNLNSTRALCRVTDRGRHFVCDKPHTKLASTGTSRYSHRARGHDKRNVL
jgi:hypothetical protein